MPPARLVPPPPIALVAPVQAPASLRYERAGVFAELHEQEVRLGQHLGVIHGRQKEEPRKEVRSARAGSPRAPTSPRPPSPLRIYDYGAISVVNDVMPRRAFTPSGGGAGYGFSVLEPIFLPLGQQRPRTSDGQRPPVERPRPSSRSASARRHKEQGRDKSTYLDKLFTHVREDMQDQRRHRQAKSDACRARNLDAFRAKQQASRQAANDRGEYFAVVGAPPRMPRPRKQTLAQYWESTHVYADRADDDDASLAAQDVAKFEENFHHILLDARATAKLAV